MDDFMKTEAKDIISTAIEKASGATGINVEVSYTPPTASNYLLIMISHLDYSLHANS